jgi:hypothetical protein
VNNADRFNRQSIAIRNAHILEMHELLSAAPWSLVYPGLDPSLTAPGAPTDIVDVPR